MPSLRRTISSPSVRPSPYTYAAPPSNVNMARAGGHGPRRSSGSETARRRVLADIDWWRVQDGQYDQLDRSSEQEFDAPNAAEREGAGGDDELVAPGDGADVVPPWQPGAASGADVLDTAVIPPPLFRDVTLEGLHSAGLYEPLSPLPQFSSLTISARTPLRRHSAESSDSSLDSTPDSIYDSLLPMPTFEHGLMDMILPSMDTYYPSSPSSSERVVPPVARSTSYSFVESELSANWHRNSRFDDVLPTPPPYFSLTRMDVDDLFY
ncbi:hypothetical protein B0H21DRAFT_14431 [Amylocystis lapponica]|nr:hypothetical protein B0H21DRAFT_14431 [Amylocystis lapponica]